MKRPNQEWCEPHLEYIRKLEAYVDYLESMTTNTEKFEECSHVSITRTIIKSAINEKDIQIEFLQESVNALATRLEHVEFYRDELLKTFDNIVDILNTPNTTNAWAITGIIMSMGLKSTEKGWVK